MASNRLSITDLKKERLQLIREGNGLYTSSLSIFGFLLMMEVIYLKNVHLIEMFSLRKIEEGLVLEGLQNMWEDPAVKIVQAEIKTALDVFEQRIRSPLINSGHRMISDIGELYHDHCERNEIIKLLHPDRAYSTQNFLNYLKTNREYCEYTFPESALETLVKQYGPRTIKGLFKYGSILSGFLMYHYAAETLMTRFRLSNLEKNEGRLRPAALANKVERDNNDLRVLNKNLRKYNKLFDFGTLFFFIGHFIYSDIMDNEIDPTVLLAASICLFRNIPALFESFRQVLNELIQHYQVNQRLSFVEKCLHGLIDPDPILDTATSTVNFCFALSSYKDTSFEDYANAIANRLHKYGIHCVFTSYNRFSVKLDKPLSKLDPAEINAKLKNYLENYNKLKIIKNNSKRFFRSLKLDYGFIPTEKKFNYDIHVTIPNDLIHYFSVANMKKIFIGSKIEIEDNNLKITDCKDIDTYKLDKLLAKLVDLEKCRIVADETANEIATQSNDATESITHRTKPKTRGNSNPPINKSNNSVKTKQETANASPSNDDKPVADSNFFYRPNSKITKEIAKTKNDILIETFAAFEENPYAAVRDTVQSGIKHLHNTDNDGIVAEIKFFGAHGLGAPRIYLEFNEDKTTYIPVMFKRDH